MNGEDLNLADGMKIYFCDGCNESIPLGDIQAGQVTAIKGKLFCRNCIPVGGVAQPTAAPSRRAATSPVLGVLVVLVFAWAVWDITGAAGLHGTGDGADIHDVRGDAADRRLDALAADIAMLQQRGDELARTVDFQRADMDALRQADAEARRAIDKVTMQADGLTRGQADMGSLIEKIHLSENRSEVLESRLNVLADKVYAQEKKLEVGLAAAAASQPLMPVESGSSPGVDPTLQAQLDAIRRQLLDPDPGQRFDGVHKVGTLRLKELAPDLVGMLRDEDPFVRERAMSVLGDFGHVDAVPALLDALEDPLPTIRRTAADTLVRLTGFDPGYDPRGTKGERDKAITRWRDWISSQAAG